MVNYLDLGDTIGYPSYNAIIYLLRKFKRLTSDLTLGNSVINTDYGTLTFTGGLTSLGGNFIIESPVTVSSNDCLRNCFYSLYFTVIDRNLSGTVNRRIGTITGNTGEDGVLEITIPTDFIASDEVILPDFKLDIEFDPHEYYTPLNEIQTVISLDKTAIIQGETLTITGTVTDKENDDPVVGIPVKVWVNNTSYTRTTDSNGQVELEYTCGDTQRISTVKIMDAKESFYENYMVLTWTGNKVFSEVPLIFNGQVVIDWGDGTQETKSGEIILQHTYTDGKTEHTISLMGDITYLAEGCFNYLGGLTSIVIPNTITNLGGACFFQCRNLISVSIPDSVTSIGYQCFVECTGLTSVTIPNSVTSIGADCFVECTGLTSVVIPDSVTSIGRACFFGCSALVDYQLYWETSDSIITYNDMSMPAGSNTVFTIPYGTTSLYTAKSYPSAKLVERSPVPDTITITSDKQIIQSSETATITALLTDNGQGVPNKTLNYEIKHGDTTISTGSDTTDSNGEIEINYTGTGTGEISIIVSYGTLLQERYDVLDALFYDDGIVNPNSNWDCAFTTRSTESNGTKFLVNTTSVSARASMNPIDNNGTPYDFDGVPMAFEFDLVDYNANGTLTAQFIQQSPTSINKVFSLKNSSYIGKTIKVVYTGTKMELYIDGVHTGTDINVTFDSNNKIRVGFAFSTANEYVIVKNVKAYSI